MPLLPAVRITGARVLRDGAFRDMSVTIAEGRIDDGLAPEIDLSGYLLLPGIVDLHGDGFERHLSPRPTTPFEKTAALRSAAAELAANGITTAWFAQSWSWEGGFRSGDEAEAILDALDVIRAELLPDVRVQIRLETHVIPEHPRVLEAVRRHGVDYVVFNNHLGEAVEMARDMPDRFAAWAAQHRRTPEEQMRRVTAALEQDGDVPAALSRVAKALRDLGVRLGSHDDATPEMRAHFREMGAAVCEFPTTLEAARAAASWGEPVIMGAPNVVRGGSQSGNVAAAELIAEGVCDALVSDYYYPALAQAAWRLADAGLMSFPAAWEAISTVPARIAGLSDRGRLVSGARADIVVVNPRTRLVEATIAGGRLAHLSGATAQRFLAVRGTAAIPA